jgi:hypothetical protein
MENYSVDLLREIAKQFRKSVRSTNLFDANVCTSPADPERPWEHLALPGDIFRHKLDIVYRGHEVTLRVNGEFVVIEVSGNFDVDVCSINRRDRVFQLKSRFSQMPGFPSLPVFSRRPDTDISQLLNSPALQRALDALRLKNNESMHIYRNGIVLYLQRESQGDVMSAVEVLCDLAAELPMLDEEPDLDALPVQFKGLSDLIPMWAVSDDKARSELIEQASHEKLEHLVAEVAPHISAINEYLDSFGDEALPEAAVALGALAECALEAQLRLRDGQKT